MAMIYKMGDAYLSASLTPKGLELRKVALSGKPDGAPVLVSRDVLEDAFRSGGKIDYFPRCCEALPDYSESPIWSDGAYEILCDTESGAEAVASHLESLYRADGEEIRLVTGYYDPEEDERNHETDRYTGWYYVGIG